MVAIPLLCIVTTHRRGSEFSSHTRMKLTELRLNTLSCSMTVPFRLVDVAPPVFVPAPPVVDPLI